MSHTYESKQTRKCSTLFCSFLEILLLSQFNKILLDAQISGYNEKQFAKLDTFDTSQDNTKLKSLAQPRLHSLSQNHPLSLVPRKQRITQAIAEHTSQENSFPQTPVSHIALHQSNTDDTDNQFWFSKQPSFSTR